MSFKFDEEKALSAVLLILKNHKGKIDRHKLFKVLYFADQKHIVRYGRPILGDEYIAMPNGPVPSNLYDAVKSIAKPSLMFKSFRGKLRANSYFLDSDVEPDLDELSESDVECLLESLHENSSSSFDQLKRKSHGFAWQKGFNESKGKKIFIQNIAIEGKASKEMLEYLKENIEDFKFSNSLAYDVLSK